MFRWYYNRKMMKIKEVTKFDILIFLRITYSKLDKINLD